MSEGTPTSLQDVAQDSFDCRSVVSNKSELMKFYLVWIALTVALKISNWSHK